MSFRVEVNPQRKLDGEVEDMILEMAHNFIDSVGFDY